MKTPIYLDYAATTPTDPAVVAVMSRYLGPDGVFGNPASRFHSFGRDAEEAVEQARVQVADLINADPREIVNLCFSCVESESLMMALDSWSRSKSTRWRTAPTGTPRSRPGKIVPSVLLSDLNVHALTASGYHSP